MQVSIARNLKAVDSLDVTVLVDNVTDGLSTVPKDVTGETALLMKKGMRVSSGHARCCAHFGLSLVVTARVGSDLQGLLFDTGPEAYALARNGDRLKVPFGEVSAIVLSHGHWDHGGGLPEAIRLVTAANGGKPVPCHVNDGMFVSRAVRLPDGSYLPFEDVTKPDQLAKVGAAVVNSPDARLLLEDRFYLSGEIPRVTPYEKGFPPHVKRSADGKSWSIRLMRACCLKTGFT
ncbi:MAG: MBL fold metallo-hydrolase [Betaproteobacteria bacterium]|nr:MBL fold metallo-hydrolase [Betaproteobacteria bacterium]